MLDRTRVLVRPDLSKASHALAGVVGLSDARARREYVHVG